MGELRDWSTTAANNDFAPAEGGMPENMDYRSVNNAARERMAAVARWLADNNGTLSATGGPVDYTLTPNASMVPVGSGIVDIPDGQTFAFTADVTSTGPGPLRIRLTTGGNYFPVVTNDGSGAVAAAGDIRSGGRVHLIYWNDANSQWILFNSLGTDLEINNINLVSRNPVRVHGPLWAEGIEAGSQDGAFTTAGGFPLSIKDEINTPVSRDAPRTLAMAFVHSVTALAGWFGFRSAAGSAELDMSIQNESAGGGVQLRGRTFNAAAINSLATFRDTSVTLFREGVAWLTATVSVLLIRAPHSSGLRDVIRTNTSEITVGNPSHSLVQVGADTTLQRGSTDVLTATATETRLHDPDGNVVVEGRPNGAGALRSDAEDVLAWSTSEVELRSPAGVGRILAGGAAGDPVLEWDASTDTTTVGAAGGRSITFNNTSIVPSVGIRAPARFVGGSGTVGLISGDLNGVVVLTTPAPGFPTPSANYTVDLAGIVGAGQGDRVEIRGTITGSTYPVFNLVDGGSTLASNVERAEVIRQGSSWVRLS